MELYASMKLLGILSDVCEKLKKDVDVFCWSLSPIFKFEPETLSQICFLQEVFDNEFTSGDGKPGSY